MHALYIINTYVCVCFCVSLAVVFVDEVTGLMPHCWGDIMGQEEKCGHPGRNKRATHRRTATKTIVAVVQPPKEYICQTISHRSRC